jgi:ataxia telangiectasia mutated family protein
LNGGLQGKHLPTPETVPFRLTRDLVDAMLLSSVDGAFRRCCEETLRVLRTQQNAFVTILEVFLYDPLFVWTLSTKQAEQRQVCRMNQVLIKDEVYIHVCSLG